MNPFLMWFIAYILPVLIVLSSIITMPNAKRGTILRSIIIHLGLLLSIILSQYFILKSGNAFSYSPTIFLLPFLASIIISVMILGKFGTFYSLSAFLQQLCMLSVTFLLLPSLPLYYTILLVIPIYSLSHLLQPKNYQIKIPLTFIWGVLSIIIFAIFTDIYLNMAIHNFIGTMLISKNFIYHKTEFKINR